MRRPVARRLVLLRHGRTAWNHEGRVQGQQDVSLDDTGRAQAAAVAPVLAALSPRRLWCSDLARTRETAQSLIAATGLDATYDVRLREFSFGERERLTHAEFNAVDAAGFAALQRGDYDAVAGAEPSAEVRTRMLGALRDLLGELAPGETGVAVSHGGAIRVATAAILGWPADQVRSLRGLDNCGWVVLEVDEAPTTAAGPGSARLAAYNRCVPDPDCRIEPGVG